MLDTITITSPPRHPPVLDSSSDGCTGDEDTDKRLHAVMEPASSPWVCRRATQSGSSR